MGISEERAGRNEVVFREVNENIVRLEERFGRVDNLSVLCECADGGCSQRLDVSADEYARVRAHPRRFFVMPGHERADVERVVERYADRLVVEKRGAAGEVAEAADGD